MMSPFYSALDEQLELQSAFLGFVRAFRDHEKIFNKEKEIELVISSQMDFILSVNEEIVASSPRSVTLNITKDIKETFMVNKGRAPSHIAPRSLNGSRIYDVLIKVENS